MPRQATFDVAAFQQQILDTILNSPVAQSRREIFDKCGFDNNNKAQLSAFGRFIKQKNTQALVDCRGDRKNRVYIATNPPIKIEKVKQTAEVSVLPPSEPIEVPVQSFGQSDDSQGRRPAQNLHRERPPKPPFTVHKISDASEVTGALQTLSNASGAEKLIALGVDKRQPKKDKTLVQMTYHYYPNFPVKQIILAAGDVVYDFDIAPILKSVYATSDNQNITGFAPFRDFFANHTIVSHDTYSACEPLIALDIPPRALFETRLAVRMLQAKAGVLGDDSLKASVARYLRQMPYNAATAIVWTLLPLLNELRVQLGDERTTFDNYCQMLPQLAHIQGEELTEKLDVDEDVIENDDVPSNKAVKITYEVMGNGEIQMTPDLSLLTHAEKQLFCNGRTLLTVKFSSKPKMFDLLPALYDANLHPVVLLSDELVFNANDDTPEDTAIALMRTVAPVISSDVLIHLRRGYQWAANNWHWQSVYRMQVDGWNDAWWDSWIDLSDVEVQSV